MLKLLVAEDSEPFRMLYELNLDRGRFDIVFAANGQEAVSLFQSFKPDIILLDLVMPVMSGAAALKEIRAQEDGGARKTVIIMVTAMQPDDDMLESVKSAADGYLLKPFKRNEINAVILKYFAQARHD